MARYRISQLAEHIGVPATTLRFYEAQGLLPAQRTPNGYRSYGDKDVERVRFIATAKDLGLPLTRIRDLLGVWQDGMCRDVRTRLLPLVAEQIADLDNRERDLRDLRRHLEAAQTRLHALPARDTPCDPSCAFLTEPALPPEPMETLVTDDVPIACSLSPAGYTDRVARWQDTLAGITPQMLADGTIRARVPLDRAARTAELIADEATCCPFLTFTLTATGAGLQLDATAPSDARPLLAELFLGAPTDNSRCCS